MKEKKERPKEAVWLGVGRRRGCIYAILTKGDKLWTHDETKETGFGLSGVEHCGKVVPGDTSGAMGSSVKFSLSDTTGSVTISRRYSLSFPSRWDRGPAPHCGCQLEGRELLRRLLFPNWLQLRRTFMPKWPTGGWQSFAIYLGMEASTVLSTWPFCDGNVLYLCFYSSSREPSMSMESMARG